MSTTVFTPKQIAQALGVSESSVKRWIDSGHLRAAKTVGGHRKVPLPSIASFLRETGHALADPGVIGMAALPRRATLADSVDDLFDALIDGAEAVCREIVLSFYQRGESIADLGDRLIGPAFKRVGDGWATGEVAVHQERRSCEVMMATLHELRRWLPPPRDDAPLALVATLATDFAEIPPRLVELTLLAEGWRVEMAGCGLPLNEVQAIATKRSPQLICVSVAHLADDAASLARQLSRLAAGAGAERPRLAVGGAAAMEASFHENLVCDLVATNLADLVAFQKTIPAQS